jgi:multidrug resistance efflux pump
VPTDFTLEGNGNLRPKIRQYIFAPLDGEVRGIPVKDDSDVKAGDLLVELQSDDLEKEINSVQGQLFQARADLEATIRELDRDARLTEADKHQKYSHRNQLDQQIISAREELNLLLKKQKKLEVRSPIDGQVVEWKLHEKLMGRPVSRGQNLMEVADPRGDWELEVRIPEARMGYIAEAMSESTDKLKVDFILATHPADPLEGWVEEIEPSAEVRGDDGNSVLMKVSFDQQSLRATFPDPKIGAGVIAKVHCGRRSIAFVWLHDLVDFIRAKVLFRL